MAKQERKPFELSGGHVALDLVNTLDDRFSDRGPQELLTDYDELLRFAQESGLLSERQVRKLKRLEASDTARAQVLGEAKELREAISAVGYALVNGGEIPEEALGMIEGLFKEAAAQRRLITDEGRVVWSWKGLGREIAAPVWLLAEAAAGLLVSGEMERLRACASDTCRWLFLDTSKNHTRRWCNMRVCGNRMKARRFHSRQVA